MGDVLRLPMSSGTSVQTVEAPLDPTAIRALPNVQMRLLPVEVGARTITLPERVDQAGAEDGLVINTVIKCYNEDIVRNTLMLALAETVDSISCTQPNSTKWIRLFVNDWLGRYRYETMEDFVLFLEGVRVSKYGPLYNGRIDGAVLFEKFQMYMKEKVAFREQRHQRERDETVKKRDQNLLEAQMSWEEKEQLNKQVEELRTNSTKHRILSFEKDSKREAHNAAGHAAVAAAETQADLVLAMTIYPYDDVQQAIQDRAAQLDVELPTRQQIIDATRELASRKR